MGRPYREDTTFDDLQPGDQLSMVCACGHEAQIAWARLERRQQLTPLRDLRPAMVCRRCGRRRPTLLIQGFKGMGGDLFELWRCPA